MSQKNIYNIFKEYVSQQIRFENQEMWNSLPSQTLGT